MVGCKKLLWYIFSLCSVQTVAFCFLLRLSSIQKLHSIHTDIGTHTKNTKNLDTSPSTKSPVLLITRLSTKKSQHQEIKTPSHPLFNLNSRKDNISHRIRLDQIVFNLNESSANQPSHTQQSPRDDSTSSSTGRRGARRR